MSDIASLFGNAGETAEDKTSQTGEVLDKPVDVVEAGSGKPDEAFYARFHNDEGNVDVDKVMQALYDTRRAHTTSSSRLAELEKKQKQSVPDTANEYLELVDKDALAKIAPKGYAKTEDDDKVLLELFDAARHAGIGVDAARNLVSRYYEGREAHLPDRDNRPEDQRKADARAKAVAEHPNGHMVANDVQAWLEKRHATNAFSEGELKQLGNMLESTDGLSLLWRLSRQATTAPADLNGAGSMSAGFDWDEERREVMKLLGNPRQ